MTCSTCAMVVGIYKPGLSPEERANFKGIFGKEHEKFIGGAGPVHDGTSSVIYCFPFVSGARRANPIETGGACVVAINSNDDLSALDSKLNGGWCFIGVDERNGSLSISRDAAGAQTVYFAERNGSVYFTSSLTLFRNLGFDVDSEAVSEFLHFLYIPAPRTIYRGVEAVMPGERVHFSGSSYKRYLLPGSDLLALLSAKEAISSGPKSKEIHEYLELFELELAQSVKRACLQHSKTALFLSGGKDSSALAIGARLGGLKNLHAVTVGFDETGIDESNDARTVACHLGIPFRPLKFSPADYLNYWREFVSAIGQPFGDPTALPVYVAMRELDGEYDVFMDGSGSDRYFYVTTSWRKDVAWYLNKYCPWVRLLPWSRIKNTNLSYTLNVLSKALSEPREEQFVSWNGWSGTELQRLTGRKIDWSGTELYSRYGRLKNSLEHINFTENDVWAPETSLRKTVQCANTLGKALHLPFFDRELQSFCTDLPSGLKFKGSTNKTLVRALLKRHLPSEIVNKTKGAFTFPKTHLLQANNYELIRQVLAKESLYRHNMVDPGTAALYIDNYINGQPGLEDRIWALTLLHSWAEFGRG